LREWLRWPEPDYNRANWRNGNTHSSNELKTEIRPLQWKTNEFLFATPCFQCVRRRERGRFARYFCDENKCVIVCSANLAFDQRWTISDHLSHMLHSAQFIMKAGVIGVPPFLITCGRGWASPRKQTHHETSGKVSNVYRVGPDDFL
jgi:hypothetical protein